MSLSVDKVLRKAQSLMKAGELAEAEELYKQVIFKFPKNKKAIQGYRTEGTDAGCPWTWRHRLDGCGNGTADGNGRPGI